MEREKKKMKLSSYLRKIEEYTNRNFAIKQSKTFCPDKSFYNENHFYYLKIGSCQNFSVFWIHAYS